MIVHSVSLLNRGGVRNETWVGRRFSWCGALFSTFRTDPTGFLFMLLIEAVGWPSVWSCSLVRAWSAMRLLFDTQVGWTSLDTWWNQPLSSYAYILISEFLFLEGIFHVLTQGYRGKAGRTGRWWSAKTMTVSWLQRTNPHPHFFLHIICRGHQRWSPASPPRSCWFQSWPFIPCPCEKIMKAIQ